MSLAIKIQREGCRETILLRHEFSNSATQLIHSALQHDVRVAPSRTEPHALLCCMLCTFRLSVLLSCTRRCLIVYAVLIFILMAFQGCAVRLSAVRPTREVWTMLLPQRFCHFATLSTPPPQNSFYICQ